MNLDQLINLLGALSKAKMGAPHLVDDSEILAVKAAIEQQSQPGTGSEPPTANLSLSDVLDNVQNLLNMPFSDPETLHGAIDLKGLFVATGGTPQQWADANTNSGQIDQQAPDWVEKETRFFQNNILAVIRQNVNL